MKLIGYTFLGFFLALISLSLFGSFGFTAICSTYGAILLLLFFTDATSATMLLAGFTVGLELLGTHRFGTASISSVIWYGLFLLFSKQLRFTSPYARFIVALLIGLLSTCLLFYPIREFIHHLPGLLSALILVSIGSVLAHRSSEPSAYELL